MDLIELQARTTTTKYEIKELYTQKPSRNPFSELMLISKEWN